VKNYLKFEFKSNSPSGKTKIWEVWGGGHVLGEIRWHPGWRKYGFFPAPNTLFEEDCLFEIATVLKAETTFHKEGV
jgi:hypothetical protein